MVTPNSPGVSPVLSAAIQPTALTGFSVVFLDAWSMAASRSDARIGNAGDGPGDETVLDTADPNVAVADADVDRVRVASLAASLNMSGAGVQLDDVGAGGHPDVTSDGGDVDLRAAS